MGIDIPALQLGPLGVMPVLVGPLQVLLALLPAILAALGGMLFALFKPSGFVRLVRFFWHQKLFTACLAAAGVAMWHGYPQRLWSGSRLGGEVSDAARAAAWPAFRGGSDRAGWNGTGDDPTAARSVWAWTEQRTVYSSPTVAGDRVYFTTAEVGPFNPEGTGAVVCVDAITGRELWRYAPTSDPLRGTFSSPAVAQERVVVGEGLHITRNARVTCLDLSGRKVWDYTTGSHVESTPSIHGDRVFVAAAGDGFYCFALAPNDDGTAKVLWHLPGDRYQDCESSPVSDGETVWFGLGDGGNAVVAVDAATGEEKWRVATPHAVFAPPTLAGGRIYVGIGNGNFMLSAEEVRAAKLEAMREEGKSPAEIEAASKALTPAGEVWCVDAASGKPLWTFPLQETVLGAIAHREGRLYVGGRDGMVRCLSSEGALLAEWNAGAPILASPALARGHVYVATKTGRLTCLKADRLQPVWEMTVQDAGTLTSSPAVAHGHVYIGTEGGGLRCVGTAEPPPPPVWSNGARGGLVGEPRIPTAVEVAWQFPPAIASEASPGPREFIATTPLMVLGDDLYTAGVEWIPDDDRNREPTPRYHAFRLKTADGLAERDRIAWHVRLPAAPVERDGLLGAGDRVVLRLAGDPSEGLSHRLVCLDAAAGKTLWERRIPIADHSGLTTDGHRLYACLERPTQRELAAYSLGDGELLWSGPLGGELPSIVAMNAPLVLDDLVVATWLEARIAPHRDSATIRELAVVAAFDAPTGRRVWSVEFDRDRRVSDPLRAENAIVWRTRTGLVSLSALDGSGLWQADVGEPLAVAIHGETLIVDLGLRVVLLSAIDGGELGGFSIEAPDRSQSLAPLFDGATALIARNGRWRNWSSASDELADWHLPSGVRLEPARLQPLVVAAGKAYCAYGEVGDVARPRGRIACLRERSE